MLKVDKDKISRSFSPHLVFLRRQRGEAVVALIIALLEHPEHAIEVSNCLSEAGHGLCVVDSFAKAMVVLQEQSFDLIISDVHLENGGSVFDFLKWVRSDSALNPIPFVLFSLQPTSMAKYLADGVQTAARTFGAAKYITMDKFDSAIFAREIAELLSRAETPVQVIVTKEGD